MAGHDTRAGIIGTDTRLVQRTTHGTFWLTTAESGSFALLTLGAHAQRGYVSVCLSVCYHASEGVARLYSKRKIPTALK